MKKRPSPAPVIIISMFLALLTACSSIGNNSPKEEIRVVSQDVLVINTSLSDMSVKADLIIIAEAVEATEIINLARMPDKLDEPDPNRYSIGQVYKIKVEQWIKGKSDEEIFIAKYAGFISTNAEIPSAEALEQTIQSSGERPLTLSRKYLMFLRKSVHFYPGYAPDRIFIPQGHPWLFDLSDENCVRYEDQNLRLIPNFPPRPLPEIISIIHDPLSVLKTEPASPYPSPAAESDCK